MSLDLYTRFLIALVLIVALLGLFAWGVRRWGPGQRLLARSGRRLGVIESATVDAKRRLVLIRRDDIEHLVLLGPDGAIVVEAGISRPSAADFAATLAGTLPLSLTSSPSPGANATAATSTGTTP